MKFKKENYRDQIREIIIDLILKEQLAFGEKLSLAEYARTLGTSVTPIREAFIQLEIAGVLESIPNVGFCVKSISHTEAEEIYTLIGMIEENALSSNYSTKTIRNLMKIDEKIKNSNSVQEKLFADNEFHKLLIDTKKYHHSVSLLKNLKSLVFLYELKFMKNRDSNIKRDEDHYNIVEFIQKGESITELIKLHWKNSYQFVINQTKIK
ncbi:MAG: GntR family transcriptional regulator [Bacteroidales bacterium]